MSAAHPAALTKRERQIMDILYRRGRATAGEVSLISFLLGNFVLSMQYSGVLYFFAAIPLLCDRIAAGRGTAVAGAGPRR